VVVPVITPAGELVAVLDLDSHQPAAFTEEDVAGLERVAARVGAVFGRSDQP
jgi:GAF domain-containing protein